MYELDSFFNDFQIAMEEKVFNYEIVSPYLKVYDQEDLKNVIDVYKRQFPQRTKSKALWLKSKQIHRNAGLQPEKRKRCNPDCGVTPYPCQKTSLWGFGWS